MEHFDEHPSWETLCKAPIHKKQIRKDDKNEQRYFNAVKEIHPVYIVIDDCR